MLDPNVIRRQSPGLEKELLGFTYEMSQVRGIQMIIRGYCQLSPSTVTAYLVIEATSGMSDYTQCSAGGSISHLCSLSISENPHPIDVSSEVCAGKTISIDFTQSL